MEFFTDNANCTHTQRGGTTQLLQFILMTNVSQTHEL